MSASPEKFLVPIDLSQLEIQNVLAQNLASAPGSPLSGQFYYDTSLTKWGYYNGSTWIYDGGGTVTSVALTVPGFLSVSGSPITGSGTLAVTLATQTANTVFSGPTSGGAATPTFRALVTGDLGAALSFTLDQFAAPAANLSINSHKLTNVANATANSDAPNYGQVLALVNGTSWKTAVAVLAHSNISLTGEQTIDGVTTSASRVGVVGQSTATQNGIYTSSSGAWTRTADLNTGASAAGAAFFVEQGTSWADTQWLCTNAVGSDVVGTNNLTFIQFGAGATYSADETTLHLTGSTFSIKSTYVGQTSITTLGTITTGTWTGTTIAVANGGTGATTASGARSNLGATGSYTALIGNGSSTSIAVTQATHGLASNGALIAKIYNASTGDEVMTNINVNNANGTVTFNFAVAPASNAYRIVIMG